MAIVMITINIWVTELYPNNRASLIAQLVKNLPAIQGPWFDSWVGKSSCRRDRLPTAVFLGFPCGSAGKESPCEVEDLGSIPGLGKSPGEGKGYPLEYSGLESSMACIVHGVAKSWTRLSDLHFHFSLWYFMCFQRTLCFPCPHLSCYIVKVYGQLLPLNNRLHRQRHVYHVHNCITEHNDWHTVCPQNLCQINKSASFIHILPRRYSQRRPRVGCTLKFFWLQKYTLFA